MTGVLTVDDLRVDDVRPLARIHRAAFPEFFLSSLGEPFLRQFYRGFLADPTAVCAVARSEDGTILGAAVGTTEPAGFFSRLLRRQWAGFAAASVRAVLARPSAAPRLARAVLYRGDPPAGPDSALLSSICVDPGAQGAGVGRLLLEEWMRRVASTGVRHAYLTTDALRNDAVNRFYSTQGWVVAQTYETAQGRRMNRYTRTLAA